ncbi:MAG: ParB/RepB/Spo0J family partition protein, partial [Chloroflexi bacterium]|nr:ParB/RepB/Spo0J family partition protein [Chloroflexota bacterium]
MPRVTDILYLNPRELEPDLQGVRTNVGDLVGLAESIREQGVLQPLGVVENSGTHRVVFGNRRREAAIIVGLDRVPCLLLEHQEEVDRLTCQLLENIQRKSLNDMEQGEALLRLRSEMGKASGRDASETSLNEKVAKRLGLSPRTVQRYVSLCKLPLAVQEAIRRDELTVTQAQHLHGLGIATRQEVVALLAIEEGMSAAELRQLCASLASNPNIDPHEALKRQRQGLAVDAS